ncbi:MAG: lysophospholipid acyltransferase family protein [Faecalibacterium sp.]
MVLYYILVPLAWLIWHIGFRIEVIGRDNLKKVATKGCILAPTHVSGIDPVFVVVTRFWGRRMVVFAKKELFEINCALSWFFRCMGGVSVRGTRDEVEVIEQTVKECRNGGTLLIFPEGTREKRGGDLLPPKSGIFVIADEAAVDVVPCRILYDTPDGRMKLFCRVKVIYGEPLPAAQFSMQGRRDTKKLRANKQALTDAWQRLGDENAFARRSA